MTKTERILFGVTGAIALCGAAVGLQDAIIRNAHPSPPPVYDCPVLSQSFNGSPMCNEAIAAQQKAVADAKFQAWAKSIPGGEWAADEYAKWIKKYGPAKALECRRAELRARDTGVMNEMNGMSVSAAFASVYGDIPCHTD